MLTILWLMYPAEGKVTCREVQLHRDCEALCSTSRDGVVSCELRVAVLLPMDPRYDISLLKVLPVLGKGYYRHLTRRTRQSYLTTLIAMNDV